MAFMVLFNPFRQDSQGLAEWIIHLRGSLGQAGSCETSALNRRGFVKMRRAHKTFAGPRVRALREARGWSLGASAQALKISVSYLSQRKSVV